VSKYRGILVLAAAACLVVAPSAASGQASAYVPLDDVAYTYVDALMARGMFKEFSMLERPFTERALRVAIDSARTREPGPIIRSYLDELYKSVEKYALRPGDSDTLSAQTFRARGTGDVYLTSQTSGRRELMLSDHNRHARPGGSLRVVHGWRASRRIRSHHNRRPAQHRSGVRGPQGQKARGAHRGRVRERTVEVR